MQILDIRPKASEGIFRIDKKAVKNRIAVPDCSIYFLVVCDDRASANTRVSPHEISFGVKIFLPVIASIISSLFTMLLEAGSDIGLPISSTKGCFLPLSIPRV